MSIAESERMKQMQAMLLDLLRRVTELEKRMERPTLRLPKEKP